MHSSFRNAYAAATLVLNLLLSACSGLIYDDISGCDTTVTLRFSYPYNGGDLLKEKIKTVRLFLFDANGIFIGTRDVSADEYAANNVPLALPKGKYRIVAVGNLSEQQSAIYPAEMKKGVSRLSDFYVAHPALQAGKPVPGNDPVYLSTIEADIPSYPKTETYIAEFGKKHQTINIYVKGGKNSPVGNDARIELKNVFPHLTFAGNAVGDIANYHPHGVKDGANDRLFSLNVFGMKSPENLVVVLKNAKGEALKEVRLTDYLKENNIAWNIAEEKAIDLVLMWHKNVWIGITIERWKEIQLTPVY